MKLDEIYYQNKSIIDNIGAHILKKNCTLIIIRYKNINNNCHKI